MIVGAYTLDLYCRNGCKFGMYETEGCMQFVGKDSRSARAQARRSGWRFVDGDVVCPKCTRPAAPPKEERP